jgi:DNA 3'-phosphatase
MRLWLIPLLLLLSFPLRAEDAKKSATELCSLELLGRRQFLYRDFDRSGNLVKIAFFDADDTLRHTKSGRVAPDDASDVEIFAEVPAKIRALNDLGYLVVIVSNQAGISFGKSRKGADDALMATVAKIAEAGAHIHYYDFAERYDRYRKPKLGMIDTLMAVLKSDFGSKIKIDWSRSFMVGDAHFEGDKKSAPKGLNTSDADLRFAENMGVEFWRAEDFRNSKEALPPGITDLE